MLFAVDINSEEVIVSDSQKGTNKINFTEKISRHDNEILYHAVTTLTSITKDSNFDYNAYVRIHFSSPVNR